MSAVDTSEKRFSKYFTVHYCNRVEQWASCFRVKTIINTNMFLEAFHRTLKVVYMQQKQNRRVDFLLHTLLKIAKDKVFDQITKLEKGKFSHRIAEIYKRHKSAENLIHLSKDIVQKDGNTWIVPSEADPSIYYTVKLIHKTCNCKLRCSNCTVCIHLYSCTCMDATLHSTVCKHVHLVQMLTENENAKDHTVTHTQTNLEYFSNLLDTERNNEVLKLQQNVLRKIDEATLLLKKCEQVNALKTASKHITSAVIVLKSIRDPCVRELHQIQTPKNRDGFFQLKRDQVKDNQAITARNKSEQNEPNETSDNSLWNMLQGK